MAEAPAQQLTVQEQKKEMIEAAKKLPLTESFSLRPRNFDEAFRFANLIAESSLIPKEFQKQPANVLLAVQLGMELGVSPMQALQNIYVVNGRPAIFGDLLPAIVYNSGLLEAMHEEGDEKQASCTVKRKGHQAITRTFTWADAVKAKLPDRNPTYNVYPKRMLQMRARALALRDGFPDVLKGVAVREELEDIEAVDITPQAPKPIAIPQPLPRQEDTHEAGQATESEPSGGVGAAIESREAEPSLVSGQSESSQDPAEGVGVNGEISDKSSQGSAPPDPQSERSVKDVALETIKSWTKENFPAPTALNPWMKGQPIAVQTLLTSAYNTKKKELGI